jgi:hypothetical protein
MFCLSGCEQLLLQVVPTQGLGLAARTNSSLIMATEDKATQRYANSVAQSLSPMHPAAGLLPVRELRAVEVRSLALAIPTRKLPRCDVSSLNPFGTDSVRMAN